MIFLIWYRKKNSNVKKIFLTLSIIRRQVYRLFVVRLVLGFTESNAVVGVAPEFV